MPVCLSPIPVGSCFSKLFDNFVFLSSFCTWLVFSILIACRYNLSFITLYYCFSYRDTFMFSVVIPLYNKEAYILSTVESVLAQNFLDFELLIVDDGSVDGSLLALEGIDDCRVRIILQSNQGVGAARNRGMFEAKYDWIAFIDADDLWSAGHLSELHALTKLSSSLGMVSTRTLKVAKDLTLSVAEEIKSGNPRLIDYFVVASKQPEIITSSSVAINKKAFDSLGGFSDKGSGEDLEYWVKVALSYSVAISDKVTSYYRLGTGGIMDTQSKAREKIPQKISSINDMSPAISLLVTESLKNPSILQEKRIKKYINSVLFSIVKVAVYNNNISVAKGYSKLALPQLNSTYIFFPIFRVTPNLILNKIKNRYIKRKEVRET